MSMVFPKWTNDLPKVIGAGAALAVTGVVAGVWYYFTPEYWEVGYAPDQPVDYSHQLHVGKLGIDCRYCHTHVEESYHANIPDTSTCMNCHMGDEATGASYLNATLWEAHKTNKQLIAVRTAYAASEPIRWKRIHKLPDYVQFNHAAHLKAGVSCYSCHGRIDQLEVVRQEKSLSMGWCLECHRNPESSLVDLSVDWSGGDMSLTNLHEVEVQLKNPAHDEIGKRLAAQRQLQPPQHCGACHY